MCTVDHVLEPVFVFQTFLVHGLHFLTSCLFYPFFGHQESRLCPWIYHRWSASKIMGFAIRNEVYIVLYTWIRSMSYDIDTVLNLKDAHLDGLRVSILLHRNGWRLRSPIVSECRATKMLWMGCGWETHDGYPAADYHGSLASNSHMMDEYGLMLKHGGWPFRGRWYEDVQSTIEKQIQSRS